MSKGVWLNIKNYAKYRGRTDIKYPQWFACSNRLLEDPDFYEFKFDEIAVWIFILSKASILKSETVFINFEEAHRKCRLNKKIVLSAIEKLKEKQMVTESVRDAYAPRTDNEQIASATGKGREGQGTEGQGIEENGSPGGVLTPSQLIILWNEHRGSLPKVEKLTDSRKRSAGARIKTYPQKDFWVSAINKAVDIFEYVPESEWRFTFDSLISDAKLTKLLEGGYDFLKTRGTHGHAKAKTDHYKDLAAKINRGEL